LAQIPLLQEAPASAWEEFPFASDHLLCRGLGRPAVSAFAILSASAERADLLNYKVEIAVCSIPALLAMKGYALLGRNKEKDAYDVYYCI